VLLEFGADPNELDWEGTSLPKDALDAALHRLHWHMGKRERELQKFADICSRLVRSGASGRATVIELPYRVSGPSGRDLENISSRSSREKEKISSVPGHLVSLILHIFRKEKQNLLLILLVLVLVPLFLLLLIIIIIILIIRFLLFLLLLLLITRRLIAIAP
jgi:Flp pilus assembly protein TadB